MTGLTQGYIPPRLHFSFDGLLVPMQHPPHISISEANKQASSGWHSTNVAGNLLYDFKWAFNYAGGQSYKSDITSSTVYRRGLT